MLIFCDFIQSYDFTTNHHLKLLALIRTRRKMHVLPAKSQLIYIYFVAANRMDQIRLIFQSLFSLFDYTMALLISLPLTTGGDKVNTVNYGHGCPGKMLKCNLDCRRAGFKLGFCYHVICFCVNSSK